MSRWALSLLLVVALASSASASLHTFTKNWANPPDFTVVDPSFELDDTPVIPGYFQANPLNTAVIAIGAEQFSLETVGVFNNFVGLTFKNPAAFVWMAFPGVASATFGGTLPDFTSNGVYQRSPGPPGATKMNGTITAVPEPSALGFGAIALGLVGVGRLIRRRWNTAS